MTHHDYIFFLQDKSRRFWGLDSNGDVVINNNPYPLLFSPDGCIDTTIENVRNKKYWAIDRTVSAPFKYVEDGAKIIKHIFYKKGIEESVYLVICSLQLVYTPGVEYGYLYKQIFRSEIDLSTFEHAGAYVTAANSEEGLAKHLKANENTVYELELNGLYIKEDGILLKEKHNFLLTEQTQVTEHLIGASFINKEGNAAGFASFSVFGQDSPGDWTTSTEYLFAVTQDITGLTFIGNFKFILDVGIPFGIRLHTDTNRDIDLVVLVSPPPTGGILYDISVNETFDAFANEKFFLVGFYTGTVLEKVHYKESTFSINFASRFSTSYTKANRSQDVFAELIDKMTAGEYSSEDCPYFGEFQNIDKVFTSGDAIRGLPDAKLKISWSLFFGFWNTYDELGIRELNKKVLFDRKNNLIDQLNVIDLGEASNLKISFDKDLPFNELAIGYPDVKNEEGFVNGKNEFNTTFVYSLGTTKVPRKYEKISQIKASCYDIENIRIDQANRDTTDNKSDNDIYVLHIAKTLIAGSGDIPDHYELDRSLNTFLIGVDEKETIFNVIFSPKRCLRRSSDFLHSSLYLADNKILKFISADRNQNMSYINGADVVVENADEPVGSLDDKFFNPVLINIDVIVPDDLLDDLDSNPLKTFSFLFDGNLYKGISIKNSINPKRNKAQTYQLWPTADTDLSPLIDYYGG